MFKDEATRKISSNNRLLKQICASSGGGSGFSEMLVTDSNGVVHIRQTTIDADGLTTVVYLDPDTGIISDPSPVFPLVLSSSPLTSYDTVSATVSGAGTIPAGAVSYCITTVTGDSFTFNGTATPVGVATISDSVLGREGATLEAITYDGLGNNLFVLYTTA